MLICFWRGKLSRVTTCIQDAAASKSSGRAGHQVLPAVLNPMAVPIPMAVPSHCFPSESTLSSRTIFLACPVSSHEHPHLLCCCLHLLSQGQIPPAFLPSRLAAGSSSCIVARSVVPGNSSLIHPLCLQQSSPFFLQLSPLRFMAKCRSLAGPCLLEVLPKSDHQPWEAALGLQFLNTCVKSFRKHTGFAYSFLLSNSCLFLVAISSIAEVPWDTAQENKVNLLKLFPKCKLLA